MTLGECLAEFLEGLGHEIAVATNGPRALHLVESFRPDAVLIDFGLPLFDGNLVAAEMRKRVTRPPRLVAMTGREGAVLASLFDELLPKPFLPEHIVHAIGDPAPQSNVMRKFAAATAGGCLDEEGNNGV